MSEEGTVDHLGEFQRAVAMLGQAAPRADAQQNRPGFTPARHAHAAHANPGAGPFPRPDLARAEGCRETDVAGKVRHAARRRRRCRRFVGVDAGHETRQSIGLHQFGRQRVQKGATHRLACQKPCAAGGAALKVRRHNQRRAGREGSAA